MALGWNNLHTYGRNRSSSMDILGEAVIVPEKPQRECISHNEQERNEKATMKREACLRKVIRTFIFRADISLKIKFGNSTSQWTEILLYYLR